MAKRKAKPKPKPKPKPKKGPSRWSWDVSRNIAEIEGILKKHA